MRNVYVNISYHQKRIETQFLRQMNKYKYITHRVSKKLCKIVFIHIFISPSYSRDNT